MLFDSELRTLFQPQSIQFCISTAFLSIYVFSIERTVASLSKAVTVKTTFTSRVLCLQSNTPLFLMTHVSQFDCYVFIIGNLSSFGFPKRPEISNKWANLLLLLSKAVTENCNRVSWSESKSKMVALMGFNSSTSDWHILSMID